MARRILGIDPGLSGALCWLGLGVDEEYVSSVDMPTLQVARGKAKRRDLDGHTVARWLRRDRPAHAFIEAAQGIPGQGAYNTGIFFQVYGELRGILIALNIPFTVVQPAVWKRALQVPKDKDGARARAAQLLPQFAELWPLKKHDGRAEAALIALYGARQLALPGSAVA